MPGAAKARSLSRRAVRARRKSRGIAVQLESGVRSAHEDFKFKGQLLHVRPLLKVACILGLPAQTFQGVHPFQHDGGNEIPHGTGPAVELRGRGSEEAASAENLAFGIIQPVPAEGHEAGQARRGFEGGHHHLIDEDGACRLDRGQLQILLGSEMGEKARLAHARGFRELADAEALQAFDGGQLHGFPQDGLSGELAFGEVGGFQGNGVSASRHECPP